MNDISQKPKAVVLLSGGLDSATVLAMANTEGFACHALSFDYGQRHHFELEAAVQLAASQAVDHRVVRLDLSAEGGFGRNALTDQFDVPKDRSDEEMTGIPITYVPARNTIFLSIALGFAEVVGAYDLFLGVNAVDYSGYPDCRPEFIQAFETLANLATAAASQGQGQFKIHAPLQHMSKADIIRTGLELGVDYHLTHSCYDPDEHGNPCGRCDACTLRLGGFAQLGREDPLNYPPR